MKYGYIPGRPQIKHVNPFQFSLFTRNNHGQESMIKMIMEKHNSRRFLLLLTATILCYCYPRLCTAQGNTSPSNNTCDTYGVCGAFGSCNSQDSPICSCVPGFIPNGTNIGCSRRVPLGCVQTNNGSTTNDGFLKLKQIFQLPNYTTRQPSQENDCGGLCLRNCSCIAYEWNIGLGCLLWSGNLMDVQIFPSGTGRDVYLRLAKSELDRKKKGLKKILILPIIIGFSFACIFTYFLWKRRAKKREENRRIEIGNANISNSADPSLPDAFSNLEDLPLFKLETLANATDNFSEANKLGKGGFGTVYKGELANGRSIAVKRLAKASGQGMQEFMNEVVLISRLQHRNLVRLLGCCVENKETMLVYEYMPNKSVDLFLFDRSQDILDWRKRFNIIEGICRGLLYLHRDSRLKIIHRDLKPSNILLDNDWNPKISDFGMARIYGTEEEHISTVRVVGTFGYMAPEYAIEGRFSEKSDVFSFGVLILEIATGKRNTGFYNDRSLNLLTHVWQLWNGDNVASTIDPRISSPDNVAEVVRCIHIALLCVQELPIDRLSVSSVLSMLRSDIVELPNPKAPAFVIKQSRTTHTGTSSSQPSNKSSFSVNDVTLSVVSGR